MDTVEPGRGIKVRIDPSGVISSNGTTILGADDKDGISVLWHALEKLSQSGKSHAPLEFLFTVGEEQVLSGSRRLDPKWLRAKSGWVFDGPGRPGTIYANGVGEISFTAKVKGKAAHSGIAPEKGINAMMLAAQAMLKFPPGRHGNATVNYGRISGGKADNIVPESVTLTGEIRSSDAVLIGTLRNELESVWSPVAALEYPHSYPSYKLEDKDFLQMTMDALRSLSLKPEVLDFKAGSDANYLARAGLSVCLLAMGRSDNHTVAETTRVEYLETMSNVAFRLMEMH